MQDVESNFAFLISSLRSSSDISLFFEDFLSDEEKTMLTKRLMLHMMLENGYQMSEIKSVLLMSFDTIRIHNHVWKKGGKTYRTILQKIAKREKAKEFWEKVEKVLKPFELAMTAKTNMGSRAKLLNRDY